MTNNFNECLKKSHEASDNPIWEQIYAKAFTGGVMVDHREDGAHQRAGIDRSIILPNSKQILIDEKVRDKNKITGKVYTDICVEYWSSYEHKIKGWVCKDLLCDYICYAILPIQKAYLMPVQELRRAWKNNRKEWVRLYPKIKAKNKGYTTISVGVPADIVMNEISKSMVIDFSVAN